MKGKLPVILTGALFGTAALVLVLKGNPANMGLCIACFLRDTAGALGLHTAAPVQYVRPEIIGLVLGAFGMSFFGKEFKSRGGSSPATRFVLGFCVMIGALMFLGCPVRMILRIGGGDMNAVVGLAGFVVGILLGIFFLNKGFTLKRTYTLSKGEGFMYPLINVVFFVILLAAPVLLIFSQAGPGSMHAPIFLSLIVSLIIGAFAQKSRFCTLAGIRDTIMFKDTHLLIGLITLLVVVAVGNIALGNFNLGFEGQPIAHSDGIWNFMGMVLVGLGSALLGGCPLRQLILSGEGNTDSVITIFGLMTGAAFAHNFKLASSADGPSVYGPYAVIFCLVIVLIIGLANIKQSAEK